MSDPIPLCEGCARAVKTNAERPPDDKVRTVHLCYRTRWGKPCGCADCHPPGSFWTAGNVEIRTDITYDLAELIRKYPDEYASVDMGGFQEWERPSVFMHEHLAEGEGPIFGFDIKEGHENFEFEETPRWTRERYLELALACPEAIVHDHELLAAIAEHEAAIPDIDPNQMTLGDEEG